jgi:hypothetical protein
MDHQHHIFYYRSYFCSQYHFTPYYSYSNYSIFIFLPSALDIYFSDNSSRYLWRLKHFQYMIVSILITFIQKKIRDTHN